MDSIQIKTIEYFAKKPHDDEKAIHFLGGVYKEVASNLATSKDYEVIEQSLDILEKFISHVASDAIPALVEFWNDLHSDKEISSADLALKKYHSKDTLYAKLIKLIGQLRYLEPEEVYKTLIKFWQSDIDNRDKVEKVFEHFAEFNLHAVEKIGFQPQLFLLSKLQNLTVEERLEYSSITLPVIDKFLVTEIESHSWNYRAVSIKSTVVPPTEEISKLRNDSVELLTEMFEANPSIQLKKQILSSMNNACRIWSRVKVSDTVREIVNKNIIHILNYLASKVKSEPLELVQKIEHDSFWRFYHADSDEVKIAAQLVEAKISEHYEYQIYRDLVGFEGIFLSWEDEANDRTGISTLNEIRKENIKRHLEAINSHNIHIWLERVGVYLQTDSRDLATFPELFRFIEDVTQTFPEELKERFVGTDTLLKAAVPVIKGLLHSSMAKDAETLILEWLEQGRFLRDISVAFLSVSKLNYSLVNGVVDSALKFDDSDALNTFVLIFDEFKDELEPEFLNQMFEKIFVYLNAKNSSSWLNHAWYRSKSESFIALLSANNLELLIENLIYINRIDHRVESILALVSELNIGLTFSLLDGRLSHENEHKKAGYESRYEALPYSFDLLKGILANHPIEIIELIKKHFKYEWGRHSFGIASLFKNCIYPFEPQYIDVLLAQIRLDDDQSLDLLLSIIGSYEGDISILPLLRKILIESEYSEALCQKINSSLISSGVVRGEFGIANSYKKKLEDIKPWLEDTEVNVVKFAHQYISMLEQMITDEVERVKEQIAIEKNHYEE